MQVATASSSLSRWWSSLWAGKGSRKSCCSSVGDQSLDSLQASLPDAWLGLKHDSQALNEAVRKCEISLSPQKQLSTESETNKGEQDAGIPFCVRVNRAGYRMDSGSSH